MEPDCLRDWLVRVLSELSPEEWIAKRDQLLRGLDETGVNVGGSMFMLGIPAKDSEELTAPDLAMLMRYVRINAPNALKALFEPLMQLDLRDKEAFAEPTPRAA
jgi:hypothetical protein